jgi:hypothetical protein
VVAVIVVMVVVVLVRVDRVSLGAQRTAARCGVITVEMAHLRRLGVGFEPPVDEGLDGLGTPQRGADVRSAAR